MVKKMASYTLLAVFRDPIQLAWMVKEMVGSRRSTA